MKLKKDNTEVLLFALKERYESQHKIRDRVQSIGIWSLGLLLAASGWLMQEETILTFYQKLFMGLGVIVGFIILRYVYLADLYKGFCSQQRVAVRLEKILGFYTKGVYDNSNKTIFPKEWISAGYSNSGGKFFDSTYLFLFIGGVFLVLAIIFNGHFCELTP